jgi:hypothetical protein
LELWGLAELRRHCFDFVEAVNHPTLHHTSITHAYEVFEHLHMLRKGIWCSLTGGQNLELWGQAELRRHDFVEAVNHPTLHHTSIIHAYEVFEHLHMLRKGIWVHPYGGAKFGFLGSGGAKMTLF